MGAVAPHLASLVELVPIRSIGSAWAKLEDWEVLWALREHERRWDGLITADHRMLALPKEMAVLEQTKLTLVVAQSLGHNPIKATGLVLAHIQHVCAKTRSSEAQVWLLSTREKDPAAPITYLERIAQRTKTDVSALLAQHRPRGSRRE